jgi:6-phosphogluconolactonase
MCPNLVFAYKKIADEIIEILTRDLNSYGKVVFIVSGGITPSKILPLVANSELDFNRIIFIASDERVVPTSSPDSTEGMIKRIFDNYNIKINYIGLGANTKLTAALNYWKENLTSISNLPVSVALLGVGEDGHFASFFPFKSEIHSNESAIAVTETPPHLYSRLTLGINIIYRAGSILLPALSDAKNQIVRENPVSDRYPVSAIINQNRIPVLIYLLEA